MNIGVIIPAYNAAPYLEAVLLAVKKQCQCNIIVVNDGSTDHTLQIAHKNKVTVLSHKRNRGKGAALRTGFSEAAKIGWKAVITLDADGQHNPSYIPKLIDTFNQSRYDIIIGSRMQDIRTMPFHRVLSNKITSGMIALRIGQRIIDSQSGFRIIKSDILRNIPLKTRHYDTESELLIKSGMVGYRIGFINVDTTYSDEPSSIHVFVDTWRFVRLYFNSFLW